MVQHVLPCITLTLCHVPQGSTVPSYPFALPGTEVASVQAMHTGGSSGRITYSIISGNERNTFLIQPSSGAISVQDSSSLDFEASPRLRLVIQAETTASFGFMAINLNLQDVNDNLPRFQLQNYVAFIWESQSYDSPVIQVLADDLDQGANGQVTYAINQSLPMPGLYHIDPQTGTITTAAILDREIWSQTRLVVTAMDRGTPPLMGSATLTVVVMDVNDNSPTIPVPWEIRVPESECCSTEGQNWGTVGTMGWGGAHREVRPVPARGWVTLAC